MPRKMPPVPPANRSNKGPGDDPAQPADDQVKDRPSENPGQQGQQANIKQNTTHQGYQQDR